MPSSHSPARVVESVAAILARARGHVVTPDLAEAIGAAVSAAHPSVSAVEVKDFLRQHIGHPLTDELVRERSNNIATLICLYVEFAA